MEDQPDADAEPAARRIRFTRGSRKHKIGKAHALAAMVKAGRPTVISADGTWTVDRLLWIADDDRGIELEVIAIDRPDCLLVIHVMPTGLKEQS